MKEAPATTGIRAYLVIAAACLAYALVLQLHGDNVQSLEVTISSAPDAVLVGSTNRFRAMISGGVAPYDCEWYCDSSLILTSFGNATAHELSYIAPNDPKQATMCFAVTDSKPDNPQFKQTYREFWQVRITLKRDGTEIPSTPPEVWAGQKINLEALIEPVNVPVPVCQWSIPATCVKDYICETSQGELIVLTPSDFDDKSVSFFWVDGVPNGLTKSVMFSANISGSLLSRNSTFVLRKPTFAAHVGHGTTWVENGLFWVDLRYGDGSLYGSGTLIDVYDESTHDWIQSGTIAAYERSVFFTKEFQDTGLDVMVSTSRSLQVILSRQAASPVLMRVLGLWACST